MMELTRRHLLKTGLATGAVLAASPLLDLKRWAEAAAAAPVQLVPSLCNGCSSHCGLIAHVKDSRVWKVTGHPDHNRSKGKLCARAHAAATWPYDPDRLTQPLKRVGEQFVPISFEKALDEIAAGLKKVLSEHGPSAVFYEHNPRAMGVFYGTRLMHALGVSTIMTHQASCNSSLGAGFSAVLGTTPGADLANSKYILFIGRNPAEGIRTSYTTALGTVLKKGAKVVSVDPRQSATAALATEWIPIRPGTDLALLLAMSHVIIGEKLYDEAFVAANTVGFEKFAEAVQANTPEWAAPITDIPVSTIARLARELAAAKPNCVVDPGWKAAFGTNYLNSSETARAVGCLNALLGNLGQPGGISFSPDAKLGALDAAVHPSPAAPKTPRADGVGIKGEFPLAPSVGIPHYLMQKAKEGKVKAGFIRNHNPVRNFPDRQHMITGMQALDLLVVVDTHLSETAMQAHYVLPEPTWLERDEIVETSPGGKPTVAMRVQAIPKIHPGTYRFDEIIVGLANRLGVGQYFNFTLDELNEARVKPLALSLAAFKEKGSVMIDVAPASPGMPKLNTPSGKAEFTSAKWADNGFPEVPAWAPPKVMPDPNNPKAFRLIHGKEGFHSHTSTTNTPHLLQISKDHDSERLWINANRARALGIADGDLLVVRSPLAEAKVRAFVTERLHPDAVYLPMGYGLFSPHLTRASGYGVSMNDFVPYDTEPISGHAMMMEVTVEVEKA
ncbi:MAG TPA: molybdopterin-dependent oxidoreductase [Symbiobacteriaceae bacterium]|nr:molybdopterin-dependent oxidoreductase [Symbiobacteriaceae bacterium]